MCSGAPDDWYVRSRTNATKLCPRGHTDDCPTGRRPGGDVADQMGAGCGHSHFLRRKMMYRTIAMISMMVMEANTPPSVPKPGYGTFWPKNPVTAVGTATMATQAVIRRMSSFCCMPVAAAFSAAKVVWVEMRVW